MIKRMVKIAKKGKAKKTHKDNGKGKDKKINKE